MDVGPNTQYIGGKKLHSYLNTPQDLDLHESHYCFPIFIHSRNMGSAVKCQFLALPTTSRVILGKKFNFSDSQSSLYGEGRTFICLICGGARKIK